MPRFSKTRLSNKNPELIAKKQADKIISRIQGRDNVIKSIGTSRAYKQGLKNVARYVNQQFNISLRELSSSQAIHYLEVRSEEVGQKTLDQERQAIQAMMQHVTHQLSKSERLPVIKSESQQILKGRAYSSNQVSIIAAAQTEKNSLATKIAYAAGLRAHEIYTLKHINERSADSRPANQSKFVGREGVLYTVQGKGGLVREVMIPVHLSDKLEMRRLNEPARIIDRGVIHYSQYDISGGVNWSSSFSSASNRTLYRSSGAHGLRHSYAQERFKELQKSGIPRNIALETVSQELGHFRPEITLVYLR